MKPFVVFINCGYRGWDHIVLMAASPEDAETVAKTLTKLDLSQLVAEPEVTEIIESTRMVIGGSM